VWEEVVRWIRVLLWKLRRTFAPKLPTPKAPLPHEWLVKNGYLSEAPLNFIGEREVLQAKAQELGLGFVDLGRTRPDARALAAIGFESCRRWNAIPVKRDGHVLWVAMERPRSIEALDALKEESGCRVIPVLAVPEEIRKAIEDRY
jgi:hypothetical protein